MGSVPVGELTKMFVKETAGAHWFANSKEFQRNLFWLASFLGVLDAAERVFQAFMPQFGTLCVLLIGTQNANMVWTLLVTMITTMTAQAGWMKFLLCWKTILLFSKGN